MRISLLFSASIAALVVPAQLCAQETTAIIRGNVVDNGAPVGGATIRATHVPSGSVSVTTSSSDGSFQFSGLRSGGPFKLEVTARTASSTVTDIFTSVGQPYDVEVEIGATADAVVTADRIKAGADSQDPETVVTAETIRGVASVNRDVREVLRRDPFTTIDFDNNAISFAGENKRNNAFTVNGVNINDRFGLNADSSPTRRGPIPLDAIEQVTVSVAPVDIRQGNFTGGAIDLTLRAGTNRYQGTGFWSINTPGLTGDRIGNSTTRLRPQNNSQTYGVSLSGPIIKNKLFFQVTGERTTQGQSVDNGPQGEGFAAPIPNLTRAQINQIQDIARSVYGYDTGDVVRQRPEVDEKIVGRIDWNITDGQKLFLTYTNSFDSIINTQNTSTSTSTPSLGLSSDALTLTELQRSGQIQLNSDWTDHFSTEIRGGYNSSDRGQTPLGNRNFAFFSVCLDPSSTVNGLGSVNTSNQVNCTTGVPRIGFGPDINRQVNFFFSDTYNGSLSATLKQGRHNIKFLAAYDRYRVDSTILRFGTGSYTFDTIADFQNRRASALTLQRPVSGDLADVEFDFIDETWTFGIQDSWQVRPNLNLTGGLRYDLFNTIGDPALNPSFTARTGFPNTTTLDGRGVFQPRFGFDWKPTRRLKVRGSAGIYAGLGPTIYVENSFAQTGFTTNTINVQRANTGAGFTNGTTSTVGNAALSGVTGNSFDPIVTSFLSTNIASLQAAETDALAPNFRVSSRFRATFSTDYTLNLGPLGDGWKFTGTYFYSQLRDQLLFTDVRSLQIGVLPDGRPRYNVNPATPGSFNPDIVIENGSDGRSHIGVVQLSREWKKGIAKGLRLSGSYTVQDVTERSSINAGGVPLSEYNSSVYADPNIAALGTADNQVSWQFKYDLSYSRAFYKDYRTIITLHGETRAGLPYSFTFQDNTSGTRSAVFGTIGSNSRYLLYVPTSISDPIVTYDNTTTRDSLDTLINNTRLREFRGQIAGKNIARAPAYTRVDLHLEQEVPTFVGKSRLSFYADIENFLNLIDSNLGVLQRPSSSALAIVRVQCLNAAGVAATLPTDACTQYRYSSFINPNGELNSTNRRSSVYFIRLGARVSF